MKRKRRSLKINLSTYRRSNRRSKKPKTMENKGVVRVIEARKKQGYYPQYRSKLITLYEFFNKLKLQKVHVDILECTPFWYIFQGLMYGNMDGIWCKKFDDDVAKIIQTYDAHMQMFKLGGKYVTLRESDVALTFGIVSGEEMFDIARGTKPTNSAFLSRRFQAGEALDSKTIRRKILEAVQGGTIEDAEDVVRLSYLFMFIHLIFSTTGQSVSWALFNTVENLNEMKKYAWSKVIYNNLSNQIHRKHAKPETVAGCVMALLYWLCEHTTLLVTKRGEKFPRFLQWNLSELHEILKKRTIASLADKEVLGEELVHTTMELNKCAQLEKRMGKDTLERHVDVDEFVATQPTDGFSERCSEETGSENFYIMTKQNPTQLTSEVSHLDDINLGETTKDERGCDNPSLIGDQIARQGQPSKESNKGESASEGESLLVGQSAHRRQLSKDSNEDAHRLMHMEEVKASLEQENSQLKQENQALLEKISKMTADYEDLRNRLEELECQLITQPFASNIVKATKHMEAIRHLKGKEIEIQKQNNTIAELKEQIEDLSKHVGSVEKQRSIITRIKTKARKHNQDPNFEYLPIQKAAKTSKGRTQARKNMDDFVPIDVAKLEDKQLIAHPNCSGLPNNDIKKQLGREDRQKLVQFSKVMGAYDEIWIGQNVNRVTYADLEDVWMNRSITSSVIDSYMEILDTQMVDQYGKRARICFFFSSFTLACIQNSRSDDLRKLLVDDNITPAILYHYVFIPIAADHHFTLLVYEAFVKKWFFFNSLRPRTRNTVDVHAEHANQVKQYIEERWGEQGLYTQETRRPLHVVQNSPQQTAGTLDCGIIVLQTIKRWVDGVDVVTEMTKEDCNIFRAKIIHTFLNHRGTWTEEGVTKDVEAPNTNNKNNNLTPLRGAPKNTRAWKMRLRKHTIAHT